MEIKVGDKVRVRKETSKIYTQTMFSCFVSSNMEVTEIEDGCAKVKPLMSEGAYLTFEFPIPLKYLIKVEDESKEPKFKVGDRVRVKGYGYEPNLHKGDIGEILDINDKGQCFVLFKKSQAWIYADCLEPCTEPTEEVNLQDATREFVETHPFDIESLKRGRKVFEDMFWDTYAADLAKEIALKVANKYNDPEQAAEYAVKVAKAVVEGLKKKRGMIHIQKQTWEHMTLYLLTTDDGSVQLGIYDKPCEDNVQAYICKLWVDEEYRRKGIATALLNTAEELARRENMTAVYLDWNGRVTPRWTLDWYFRREYNDVAFGKDNALMKLTLKGE